LLVHFRVKSTYNYIVDEFQNCLETLQLRDELYILGDFNTHVDLPNAITRLFMDALQTFDLQQHVSFLVLFSGGCEIIRQSLLFRTDI